MKKTMKPMVAAACLAALAAGAAEKPYLIVNLDQNHYPHQFSEAEMTEKSIEKYIDEYLGGAVTHVFINPNAMRAFYDSKVMEPIWHACEEPGVLTDVGWLRKSKLLHERGIDLYGVMFDRIRRKGGAEAWVSMRMNDVHCVDNPRHCLLSTWWLRRPDLWRVPFDSSKVWQNRAFDYSHKEVRDYHLAAAVEMIERYDCDGFEADWTRFPWHLTPGKEKSQSHCLTEVMRGIRKAADAAAKRRGRPVKVAATVLSSPEAASMSGTDVVTWAKEGLIDLLLVSNHWAHPDFETPWKEWCRIVHAVNPRVRVVPRLDDGVSKTPYKRIFMTEAEYSAYFERLLAHGCRDFAFFNIFVKKNTAAWKWKMAVEEGVRPERVRSVTRRYPSSFRDVVPAGCPTMRRFPFNMTDPRTVTIEIGSAAGASEVYVNAAFESELKSLPELTLNSSRALVVDGKWDGRWVNPGSKKVKRYVRYSFPASSLKDGVNEIAFPALPGGRACGCEIEVVPGDSKRAGGTAVLHVAPGGDDAAAGSEAMPLKTLSAACLRARKTGGAKIVLADGVYEESLELTRQDRNLVFEAAPGAKPVISAGRRITVWRVDPKGWWRASVPRDRTIAQIYVDGQRRTRPFLPRRGYYAMAGAGKTNFVGDTESFICRKGDFPVGDNPGMEVCVFHVWALSRSAVKGYDPVSGRVSIDIEPFKRGYEKFSSRTRYRFDNVLTALGEPGDWYHDRKAGELIYVPMKGECPRRSVVTAAWHRHAVRAVAAEDVVFRGIVFAHAGYGLQKGGNYLAQAAANQPGAFHAEDSRRIRLENCAVMHTGAYGAVFTRGSEDCTVEGCEFADLGAGGVRIGDGWEKGRPIVLSERCTVRDCIIEGGGRVDPAGVGVWIGHGANNLVSHNTIRDLYYTGVSAGWCWNLRQTAYGNIIEWNHIHDIGQGVLSDMGGIYLLGRQPGTVERYNHIHHVTRADNCAFGIYFDSGTAGVTVSNNVVHDCTDSNFFCARISESNRVENNIFAYAGRHQISTPQRSEGGPSFFRRNLLVWDEGRLMPSVPGRDTMVFGDNLAWSADEFCRPGKADGFTLRDPGFKDPAARDFRLKDGAAARAVGFVPFSIEGCGRISPRRFTVGMRGIPPVFFPKPEPAAEPVAENFESVAVGGAWPGWHTHPPDASKVVRVTDAVAAEGRRSLEVIDDAEGWMPHMYTAAVRSSGRQRISFSLKLEKGAQPGFEVREEEGVWQWAPGPKVHVTADGTLMARGRKLMKVPYGTWFRIELEFTLGKDSSAEGYSVSVKLPGEKTPRTFAGNPLHRRFRTLRWLGFVSSAKGGVRYWIDDFRLTP